jgi:nicotinamide riboside kinase
MIKIVITGPESTGKTSIANYLSEKFNLSVVKEFAVEYLEKTDGKYKYNDLKEIAKRQIESENEIIEFNNPEVLICDTDLFTLKIWSEVRFNKIDKYIIDILKTRKYHHYILCYPDIDWEYAKFRENPDDRDFLYQLYLKELINQNKNYSILKGTGRKRFKNAEKIFREIIKNKSTE